MQPTSLSTTMTPPTITRKDYTAIPSSTISSFLPPASPPQTPSPSFQYLLVIPLFLVILFTVLYLQNLPQPKLLSVPQQRSSPLAPTLYNYTQVRAATLSCTPPLLCRATLLIERSPSATILYAGYMIYVPSISPLHIDPATRNRVAATNPSEALRLARELVSAFAPRSQLDMCTVDLSKVTAAVRRGAMLAALCVNTNDPLCFSSAVVAHC